MKALTVSSGRIEPKSRLNWEWRKEGSNRLRAGLNGEREVSRLKEGEG